MNIYSTLSCSGFILSSTCDSYWELSSLKCGPIFFFSWSWFILLVFTDLHSPIPIMGMYSLFTLLMLGSALWYSLANGMWGNTVYTSSQAESILSLLPCGFPVCLVPSLCHENENVLDQGYSFSLNLRKSRPHSLALTCSLELQQLFSTFVQYLQENNSCSWNLFDLGVVH